jgi:hypothetical protein
LTGEGKDFSLFLNSNEVTQMARLHPELDSIFTHQSRLIPVIPPQNVLLVAITDGVIMPTEYQEVRELVVKDGTGK